MEFNAAFIGLVLSLIYIGLTGLYPGGIIVPSFLILFIDQPLRITGTLIVALLTYYCYRLASNYWIIFGRRRFTFMILLGGIWTYLWMTLIPGILPISLEFRVVGWVIPGLIANNFERQGVFITTASIMTVLAAGYFINILYTNVF